MEDPVPAAVSVQVLAGAYFLDGWTGDSPPASAHPRSSGSRPT